MQVSAEANLVGNSNGPKVHCHGTTMCIEASIIRSTAVNWQFDKNSFPSIFALRTLHETGQSSRYSYTVMTINSFIDKMKQKRFLETTHNDKYKTYISDEVCEMKSIKLSTW